MATIKHSLFVKDVSAQNALRQFVRFLVSEQPKTGEMWKEVYSRDSESAVEFGTLPIAYIIKKAVDKASTAYMYVKLVMNADGIYALASMSHNASTDNNADLKLSGSWASAGEAVNTSVMTYDHVGAPVTPNNVLKPMIRFDSAFNPALNKYAKVWIVRRLGPRLDAVTPRKLTDIFAWMTVCVEEEGANPISKRGYFSHIGFGMAGDTLTTDVSIASGAGLYVAAGSFASKTANTNATSDRIFAGGGSVLNDPNANIGCVMCGGKIGPWDSTNIPVWFYANSQYGYCRDPFDDDTIVGANNVGFDFTELTRYSPYSGVRTLTPAYIYGHYDGLFRTIGRIPIVYTSLEGLYAGDTISQDRDDDKIVNFILFPFWHYTCDGAMSGKLGYAIHVPLDDDV